MGFYNLLLQIAVILENNWINKIQNKWVTRQNIHRENSPSYDDLKYSNQNHIRKTQRKDNWKYHQTCQT